MKFSEKTIEVLENFVKINPSIVFRPGTQLKTMMPTKTVVAVAEIEDEVSDEFGVYALSMFLTMHGNLKEPELTVIENKLMFKDSEEQTELPLAEPSLIVQPPEKEMKFPEPDVSVELTDKDIQRWLKMSSDYGTPDLLIEGEKGKVRLATRDVKNPSSQKWKKDLGETDQKFSVVFKATNLILLPGDYKVEISKKGLARFKSDRVTYYIAVETTSKFE